MPGLPHLDDLTGLLSRLTRLISPRVQNTLDRVSSPICPIDRMREFVDGLPSLP